MSDGARPRVATPGDADSSGSPRSASTSRAQTAAGDVTPGPEAPPLSADQKTRQAFRQLFPGVMVAMFLASADQTILASALPVIASRLGGLAYVSWVVVGYLLAATIAAPLYGHLGDRFGRKRMLLVALAIFTAASIACAGAPTLLALIVARALQGLGGGGLMTLAQALIGEHVAPRDRGRYQGYFAAVFALASTSGPILGAYLTEHVSWRAVFAINLPLGVLAGALAWRIPQAAPVRVGRYQPDVVGIALFCIATLGLLVTMSSAGHALAFGAWPLYALIAGVAALYVALYAWEARSDHPIIPVRLLARAEIARPDGVVMCFAATLFATVLYLPLYLQVGRGLSVGASGTLLLPVTLAMVSGATLTGRLVSCTGKVTVFPVIGLGLATTALLALGLMLTALPTAVVMVLTGVLGFGLGMVMPAMQVAVQHAAGRESLGAAIGAMSLCRSVGGAIGVAVVGAIVFASIGGDDGALGSVLARVMDAGPESLALVSNADRAALVAQLDRTFRMVFLCIAVVTAGGTALAWTVPGPKL